jgi:transcriptional regulator with AAA-type ATPase domain
VREAILTANQPAAIALRLPILFLGEPGVGKNHAAHVAAAHRQWLQQPEIARELYLKTNKWRALTTASFREIPLTTLPENLIESELFGFVKGAFTGAVSDHEGIFGNKSVADVLLDEIGDVGLAVQPKLLQIIQSGVYRRVGSKLDERRETSIRVLLATNQNLPQLVANKDFRDDLYWRISQIVVWIPPLRNHLDEIPLLMETIRDSILFQIEEENVHVARALEKRKFTSEDVRWATTHDWPGNIREIERLVRLWLILPSELPLAAIRKRFPMPSDSLPASDAEAFIRMGVRRWIEEMKSGRRTSPGTIGGVLSGMNAALRAAWADLNLPAEDLLRLFPNQDIANVRSRLSRYARTRKPQ